MIDIYSRYIVGARVHARESGPLAESMMREVFGVHGVPHVVHPDRGTSMTSKSVADLLEDLDVTRSHSRPKVSNDNPYSEAWLPGRRPESHRPPPTDPDVNLSTHPARAVQFPGRQYRSAQCTNRPGDRCRTPFSHARALIAPW